MGARKKNLCDFLVLNLNFFGNFVHDFVRSSKVTFKRCFQYIYIRFIVFNLLHACRWLYKQCDFFKYTAFSFTSHYVNTENTYIQTKSNETIEYESIDR